MALHEGPRALFHGVTSRCLTMGLSGGILLSCYSTLREASLRKLGYLPSRPPPPRRTPTLLREETDGWARHTPW